MTRETESFRPSPYEELSQIFPDHYVGRIDTDEYKIIVFHVVPDENDEFEPYVHVTYMERSENKSGPNTGYFDFRRDGESEIQEYYESVLGLNDEIAGNERIALAAYWVIDQYENRWDELTASIEREKEVQRSRARLKNLSL